MASVQISRFVQAALLRRSTGKGSRGTQLGLAISFYLRDRDRGSPAWAYPGFLRDTEPRADSSVVEVEVEDSVWALFEAEAERQGVGVSRLAEHAALYFAAAMDAGRVTQRFLEDQATTAR